MKINNIWIVVTPTKNSVKEDLVAGGSLKDLQYQFVGGLSYKEIDAVFTTKVEADKHAAKLIRERR